MSEPTYRIEIEYDPGAKTLLYDYNVIRLADNTPVGSGFERTKDEAIREARALIARLQRSEPAVVVYATEDGEIVPAPEPQSLRA